MPTKFGLNRIKNKNFFPATSVFPGGAGSLAWEGGPSARVGCPHRPVSPPVLPGLTGPAICLSPDMGRAGITWDHRIFVNYGQISAIFGMYDTYILVILSTNFQENPTNLNLRPLI